MTVRCLMVLYFKEVDVYSVKVKHLEVYVFQPVYCFKISKGSPSFQK